VSAETAEVRALFDRAMALDFPDRLEFCAQLLRAKRPDLTPFVHLLLSRTAEEMGAALALEKLRRKP